MQPIQTSEPLPALDVELAGLAMMNPIDPRPAYVDALSRCPMARTPTGSVAVFDMDLLVEINRHPGIHGAGGSVYPKGTMGAERPLIPLDLDGEDHRKFRHLLDPMFSPRRIAGLEKRVRSRTNALIDQFIDAGRAELYESFCNPLPSGIFLDIMGVPNSELDNFVRFKDAVVRPSGDTIEEMMASSQAAGKNTYAFFNAFLDERAARHEPGDDLIGWLMTAEIDERPLTRLEILDTTYLLMIAGLDTVAGSFSCLLAWLATHPDERRWIAADSTRWPHAIEELMRFESPVMYGSRTAMRDVVIDGRSFPAGTTFSVSWSAANLDPKAFENPTTVILDREPNRHAGFATGFHRCLGSHLARMELRAALEEFHSRIPEYWVDDGDPIHFTAIGVRIADRLPLVWA